ncbi:hypothetical protein [uncultured Methanobrevibacter sp.]|uniref:hypothetical protein n=1 Tax=uncultured Methanobrevibacter sp. TaxID=253161 RepID=UPI0025FB079A|nr:hypothetical protein [uncultured Methanobrevibacter sp.]
MKSKRYLFVLSILMILFVFVSSAGAADANATDVLSVDESANMVNNEMDVLSIDESVNFENNETNILSADNNVNNDEILGNDLEPGDDNYNPFSTSFEIPVQLALRLVILEIIVSHLQVQLI